MFIKFLVFIKYSIFSYELIHNQAFSSSLQFKKHLFFDKLYINMHLDNIDIYRIDRKRNFSRSEKN